MNYPRIFERVYLNPVCVTAERFASIHAYLLPRLKGNGQIEVASLQSERPTRSPYDGKRAQRAAPLVNWDGKMIDPNFYSVPTAGVAVIPIYGALAKNLTAFEESCGGGTDINGPIEALRQAMAAPDIKRIILDFDSPGGEVTNIPEFAAAVAAANKTKPVTAFTDAAMCSAAYWLGSQAGEIVATQSATLGSVGTYLAWLDESVRMSLEGVTLQFFAAGKHKGIGLPGRPLSADDKALLQARVDTVNGWFLAAVQSGRAKALGVSGMTSRVIDPQYLEGQSFTGDDALMAGLADRLVNSFDEIVSPLAVAMR